MGVLARSLVEVDLEHDSTSWWRLQLYMLPLKQSVADDSENSLHGRDHEVKNG